MKLTKVTAAALAVVGYVAAGSILYFYSGAGYFELGLLALVCAGMWYTLSRKLP